MNKNILLVLLVLVVGGGAFYGGMRYSRSSADVAPAFGKQGQIPNGTSVGFQPRGNFGTGTFGTGAVNGEIIAKDATSFTVKSRDGGSRIVFYSTSVEVGKFVSGTANDLVIGKTVVVTGKTNTDGSITATSVQLRPPMPSVSPSPTPSN